MFTAQVSDINPWKYWSALVVAANVLWSAIALGCEVCGMASPLGVRAHSTWSVASSKASKRAPLQDICAEEGWSSLHTFIRFCSMNMDSTLGSQVDNMVP